MRRPLPGLATLVVTGTAFLAYAAVGNGDIVPTSPLTVVTITSPSGTGSGTATLQNTTSSTTYNVLVGADSTCDPGVGFTVPGGNPITSFGPSTSRNVQINCPARGTAAMQRCLFHATSTVSAAPLADFMGLCLYGDAGGSLAPAQTSLDFGTVSVGDFAEQTLSIRNDGTGTPLTRVFLMSSDIDGNFELSTPCNPDAANCDAELTSAVGPGSSFSVGVKCRPQTPGTHTAQLYVGTDTFQLLSLGVTLQCTGAATNAPALGVQPTTIEIPAPVEVSTGSASVVVHLANTGGSTLVISDIRTVDVDTGAADEWSYVAAGDCSGQITSMCSLAPGDKVDVTLTFNPNRIGSRRAALLITYRDTIDRTFEVPLVASGLGATVRNLGATSLVIGSVPVGRMSQGTIALVNDGNRDANVSLAVAATPPFTVGPGAMTTVTPGTPRIVTVTCAPQAAGTATSTVTVQGTDTLSTTPLTIGVTCEGITDPLYATPSALSIDEIRLDAPPIVQTIQLASTGGELTFEGPPVLESPNAAITLGTLSQQTTPASLDVTITPQSQGTLTAAIKIATTDGQTLRIPIAGAVVKPAFQAADALDLGTFCVDQPTASSNLGLLSTGTGSIELSAPVLGQVPSPFELAFVTPLVYPYPLAPSSAAVVTVTPKRQRTAVTVSDTLMWRTDLEGTPAAPTQLTARFINSGGAIAPPALNFGEVIVHLFSVNGQRVVIQNCNPTPLVLDPPNIRTPFSIDSPKFPTMLAPNESVAFSVGFHPTRVGTVMDTLRITSPQLPGAPLEVTLVGTGSTGDMATPDAGVGTTPPDDTSFYACSCSGGGHGRGGWVIALAVMSLFVPRRRGFGLP